MKVTQRSAGHGTSMYHDRPRKHNNHISIETISKVNTISQCIGQVSRDFLTTFSQIWPNIWYSMEPYNDEKSDLSGMVVEYYAR